jgi:hypothetical protein
MYNFFNIKNRFSNGKRKILFWLLFFLGFVLGAMNSIGELIACAKKKKKKTALFVPHFYMVD